MLGTNIPDIDISDGAAIAETCSRYGISYVFSGTETPLVGGVPEYLTERGIRTFGAPFDTLQLESDRIFSKAFMESFDIPSSSFESFSDIASFTRYLDKHQGGRFVIKLNELSPSRIMLDSSDPANLTAFAKGLLHTGDIIVEEHLKGMPLTLTVLFDGNGFLMLPVCSDYTKAGENDYGAATGGMGSISPVPVIKAALEDEIRTKILEPTFEGLKYEKMSFKGVLIFSLILTEDGPKLVDYHVRFNDPATQAMAPLIQSDFIDIVDALEENEISNFRLAVSNSSSVAVVVASEGYPNGTITEQPLTSMPNFCRNMTFSSKNMLFYGAVEKKGDRRLVTTGGRCFTAVGLGTNIIEANSNAYSIINDISFKGSWFRKDIGNKFFED